MNLAVLVGNATRDPEARYSPSGTMVVNLGIATNEKRGGEDFPEFHNLVVFGGKDGKNGLAGVVADYVRKGSKIAVRGRIQTRTWEAQDGSKRKQTEIIVDSLDLLSPKPAQRESADVDPDDIPF